MKATARIEAALLALGFTASLVKAGNRIWTALVLPGRPARVLLDVYTDDLHVQGRRKGDRWAGLSMDSWALHKGVHDANPRAKTVESTVGTVLDGLVGCRVLTHEERIAALQILAGKV